MLSASSWEAMAFAVSVTRAERTATTLERTKAMAASMLWQVRMARWRRSGRVPVGVFRPAKGEIKASGIESEVTCEETA
jgi:hypothetical protein